MLFLFLWIVVIIFFKWIFRNWVYSFNIIFILIEDEKLKDKIILCILRELRYREIIKLVIML